MNRWKDVPIGKRKIEGKKLQLLKGVRKAKQNKQKKTCQ